MGTWPGQGPELPILPGVGRGSTALVEERSAPHWAQGRTQEVGYGEGTGRGESSSGPRRNKMESGSASMGRCAQLLEGGQGWCQGRGRRLPAFFTSRSLWSMEWR